MPQALPSWPLRDLDVILLAALGFQVIVLAVNLIVPVRGERYRVLATTSIQDFNDFFECALPDDEVDTIGGLVTANLGYVPVRGEGLQLQDWHFTVIRADSRRLQALLVERRPPAER